MKTGRTLKSTTSASKRRLAAASVAALAVAAATAAVLPTSVFRSDAIVAIDDTSAALRLAAARSAADLAVSKPVILRAAASLNGTSLTAPAPALAEKIGVATGLSGATGAVARLADTLAPTISAQAGDGFVELQAVASDGTRAARVATALAEALVAEEEGSIASAARRREIAAATTLEALREVAREAHARLAALGASETDPADALSAATAGTRSAEARASAIHAVIVAGTPPLGAGTELPQTAATLQQTYWDLKKQLDKANETLGERHTTVIALRDGVSRAAASLTAEWQRIERGSANDLSIARSREAVLRKAASAADPVKHAAADEAREAARLADVALARAETPIAVPLVAATFRLVAPASVPATASGLDVRQRGSIIGFAGASAFALTFFAIGRRRRRSGSGHAMAKAAAAMPPVDAGSAAREIMVPVAAKPVEPLSNRAKIVEPLVAARDERRMPERRVAALDVAHPIFAPVADTSPQSDDIYFDPEWFGYEPDDFLDDRMDDMPLEADSFHDEPSPAADPDRAIDRDLRDALRAVAADLKAPGRVSPATVMIAANASGADTGAVALALGEAAAELGYRVLVIETERARSTLAEAVAPQGDPLLVDAFGALRVALPAEHGDGLFLAPAFREGAHIAAALARNTRAELIDDLAAVFDAVVIDGGRASDATEAGWSADTLVRVGRFASRKDDAYFLAALHAPSEALLGTVAAGRFVARESELEPLVPTRSILRAVPVSSEASPPRRAAPAPMLRVPSRRRTVAR